MRDVTRDLIGSVTLLDQSNFLNQTNFLPCLVYQALPQLEEGQSRYLHDQTSTPHEEVLWHTSKINGNIEFELNCITLDNFNF